MRAVDGARVDERCEAGMDSLKLWDQYAKLLANRSSQALVSFLMPKAVFKQVVVGLFPPLPYQTLNYLDKNLTRREIRNFFVIL